MEIIISIYFLSIFTSAYQLKKEFENENISLMHIIGFVFFVFMPIVNTFVIFVSYAVKFCFWASDFIVIRRKND